MPLAGRNLTLEKTPLRFNENASAFQTKRPCVWIETQGRFTENSFTFYFKRKGVFFGVYPRIFQWFSPHRNSQKATAEAAATLSESTPCAMGIRTT